MFEDIGVKLKTLARFVCWGGIIVSCLFGLAGGVSLAVMTNNIIAAIAAGLLATFSIMPLKFCLF